MTASRANDIALSIASIARKGMDANGNKVAAQAATRLAGDAETSAREALLIEAAAASVQGDWSEIEISQATSIAVKSFNCENDKVKKTLEVLASEMKAAMHPNARAHVKNLFDLRNAAWLDEVEAHKVDKAYERPLLKAFQREYHMFKALITEAKNENRIYTTVQECIALAKHLDPAFKKELLIKRYKAIAADLKALRSDCDVPAFANILSDMEQVGDGDIEKHIKDQPAKPVLAYNPKVNPPTLPTAPKGNVNPPTLPTAPKGNVNNPTPPARHKPQKVVGDNLATLDKLLAA